MVTNSVQNHKTISRSQERFRSEAHVFTEKNNKIALSSNDDKRLETFDGTASYPYDVNARKVCKKELLQYLI